MQKGVIQMKNRVFYIVAMSITLLLSYGVFYFMSETNLAAVWAVFCFAVCEFFIQLSNLSFGFPFVKKRISKVMFDIVIFSRLFSVFDLYGMNISDIEKAVFYVLMTLIPIIFIFIEEKKSTDETPKQGFAPVLVISALFLLMSTEKPAKIIAEKPAKMTKIKREL
jgi:hypothetical protein